MNVLEYMNICYEYICYFICMTVPLINTSDEKVVHILKSSILDGELIFYSYHDLLIEQM